MAALFLAPEVVLERLGGPFTPDGAGHLTPALLYALLVWFTSTLGGALLVALTAEPAYLIQGGCPVPLAGTLRRGFARVGAAIGVSLVLVSISLGLLLCLVLVSAEAGPLASVAVALLLTLHVQLQVGLSVAVPAVVMESLGVGRALARSWRLTTGYRGTIFAAWMVLMLAEWLLTMLGRHLTGADPDLLLFPPFLQPGPATAAGWWISVAVSIAFASIEAVGVAVLYGALRSAKERVGNAELLEAFK